MNDLYQNGWKKNSFVLKIEIIFYVLKYILKINK